MSSIRVIGCRKITEEKQQQEEAETIRVAGEICNLCMRINLKTNYNAWFDIAGHVDWITVVVRKKDSESVEFGSDVEQFQYVDHYGNPTSETLKILLRRLKDFVKKINKERNI